MSARHDMFRRHITWRTDNGGRAQGIVLCVFRKPGFRYAFDALLVANEKGETNVVEFSDVTNVELDHREQGEAAPRKEK